jgi:mevalonate kinase
MTTFYANGKLLLTGEYFILDGAKGLALPTKFGQRLDVEERGNKGIQWKSIDHEGKIWFEAEFSESLEILSSTDKDIADRLKKILSFCPLTTYDLQLTTTLDFPRNWGLGTSSTLISLLSQYINIDPYELLAKTFGGSGYDIACATAKGPVTFQLSETVTPLVSTSDFNPTFKDNLYFIYLGKKQDSREGIHRYKNISVIDKHSYVEEITDITNKLIQCCELDEFCYYLEVHENIISEKLKLPKVKDAHFHDFPYTVKSLGAWGGDFVMAASEESTDVIANYFREKGFAIIIPYSDMIL